MNRGWQCAAWGCPGRSLGLLAIFLIWLSLIQPTTAQDNGSTAQGNGSEIPSVDETLLIDGLRTRRLFDLAELHCRQVLATPSLTPTQQAVFTIELLKTQTARAILSSGPERDSAWQAADQEAARFLSAHKNHPRVFLVQVQAALSHLSRGQLIRQELSAEMVAESARDQALDQLRKARALLGEVQREIVKAIPEQRGRTLGTHELSIAELMELNNNVRFQLAIANVTRAMLYTENDRLNRIDALNNVLERLKEVQGQTSQGQPLWWKSQVLQIECFRLLGKIAEARASLQRVLDSVSPDEVPQSLFEEQLRLALDQSDQSAMMSLLNATQKIEDRNPQLELARLEVMMQLAALASGEQNRQWLTAASQLTRFIESNHGGYWGRRAELVLIGPNDANRRTENPDVVGPVGPSNSPLENRNAPSAELDLLMRLADNALRNGRFDDAVRAYDKAFQAAQKSGENGQAFSLVVRASQALEKQRKHQEAAKRLIELAKQNTRDARSSAAHLRGCWNFSQTTSNDPERVTEYLNLLEQHLGIWPQAATANQAKLWLAGQQQTRRDWQQAFENYASINPSSPLFVGAITRAAYCAQRILDATPEAELRKLATRITNRLQSILDSTKPASSSFYEALLALTDIGLLYGTLDPAQLAEPLGAMVASAANPDMQRGRGRAWLLVVSVADPTKVAEAEKLLEEIGENKRLLATSERGLSAIVQHQAGDIAGRAKQLRLQVTDAALSLELEKQDLTFWLYRKSEALTDLNRFKQALSVLTKLEKDFPRDAVIQLRIARLLTRVYGDQEPAKPLTIWRRLAGQLKPHTSNWYEAKFQVASLLERTGKKQEARKLLEYLQAVPPGWEQSHLKDEFERLLAKCK